MKRKAGSCSYLVMKFASRQPAAGHAPFCVPILAWVATILQWYLHKPAPQTPTSTQQGTAQESATASSLMPGKEPGPCE